MRSVSVAIVSFVVLVGACGGSEVPTEPAPTPEPRDPCFEDPSVCEDALAEQLNARPGSGAAFIIDGWEVLAEGRGFDVDGSCRGEGDCLDNALHFFGQVFNDQLRQGIRSGESLTLFELSGLEPSYTGNARALAVKTYAAHDADDPFFPANNFENPRGSTKCCEFHIDPASAPGSPPQARSRMPAQIEQAALRTWGVGALELSIISSTISVRLTQVTLHAGVDSPRKGIEDGQLGGVWGISALTETSNPFCRGLSALCPSAAPDSTMLDFIAAVAQPDIDGDGDGLEVLRGGADGRIAECTDGDGSSVAPVDPARPWTCALQPAMADGYSIALGFTAVPATILGVSQ